MLRLLVKLFDAIRLMICVAIFLLGLAILVGGLFSGGSKDQLFMLMFGGLLTIMVTVFYLAQKGKLTLPKNTNLVVGESVSSDAENAVIVVFVMIGAAVGFFLLINALV